VTKLLTFLLFGRAFFRNRVNQCVSITTKLMYSKYKMLNYKKYAALLALFPVVTLWTQAANAETLKTKNFNVTITRNCPEGYVTCNNVTYYGS
jgi:hypothetical protein